MPGLRGCRGLVFRAMLGLLVVGNRASIAVDYDQRLAELEALDWKEVFRDDGSGTWQDTWFLDGLKATVANTADGMVLSAGAREIDSCHAVLWTKESFAGDIRIAYDYTKTDASVKYTTLIYVQATGIGRNRDGTLWDTDITVWNDRRTVPRMNVYFDYMNLLHISYASDGNYVRARRYPTPEGGVLDDAAIEPDYLNVNMFEQNVTYHITIIKKGTEFYMHAQGPSKKRLFPLNYGQYPEVREGRIGLRHMYTRSARYKDFRVAVYDSLGGTTAVSPRELRSPTGARKITTIGGSGTTGAASGVVNRSLVNERTVDLAGRRTHAQPPTASAVTIVRHR